MSVIPPSNVRPPAVAGLFYPADPATLAAQVEALLDASPVLRPAPKALIVPHAGYVYCGAVAANAYVLLRSARDAIRRVVLLGPSHRVPLADMAVPSTSAFRTPLGTVPLDRVVIDALVDEGLVRVWDAPHEADHALEVQLPFLQTTLTDFSLVPVSVGACAPEAVAAVLDRLWGGEETLVVVSSDLSHFHDYAEARRIDRATCDAIVRRETSLEGGQACGCHAVNGLLQEARARGLDVALLGLCNSGDTAGGRHRVVGYGSFALS